jgi:2-dehydro-3-deoxyphosphogluconate aldolase/(4S)-4-hydroxy-2-oxoglutarate aldolase
MSGSMLGKRLDLPAQIARAGVVAIGRRLAPERIGAIAEALVTGGVGAFEITLDSNAAFDAIGTLAARFSAGTDLLVGAGTVLDEASATRAVEAGARFLVTPTFDEALVRAVAARGIAVLPGAFSPTEVLAAWRAGATAVKLFPASSAGPAFIREIHGPFPDIVLVPTGGVTIESAVDFIAAGAAAVGLGGSLIGDGDPVLIESRARRLVEAIAQARAGARR